MRRKLFSTLLNHLPKKEFTIVTGARQSGKTTLLRNLELHCKDEDLPTVFINLENKTLLADLNNSPTNLLAYLPNQNVRTVVFLDEVQYLSDPSHFLKFLYDEYKETIKVVASGSSAFYIDSKFKDSLAGRKRIFQLMTCDFEDFLVLQGKDELWEEVRRIKSEPKAKSLKLDILSVEWENFMLYGGYPAVVTENSVSEKIETLKEIRDSFIKRDILESGVQNELVFYNLFQLLASQPGQLININELSNTLRVRNETIQNYLDVMEKCFHLKLVRPFYGNLRKELVKMPKSYLLDSGLRNSLINNFSPVNQRLDRGELWEQTVFRLLADRYGMEEIRFWRTANGNEVDFILPNENPPLAIESKYEEGNVKKRKYSLFKENYPEFDFQFASLRPWSEDFFRKFL